MPTQCETRGDNSWSKSVRVVFLVPDTPTKCPQQPDSFIKIAQRVGVIGCTIMRLLTDRWMDGRMESMLIAISPKSLGRRITKLKKILMV